MLGDSLRALRARPRTLIAGVAMVMIAVTSMVLIPTLTDAASRKVLADLNALGSNAWIVVPRQLPTGPPAHIPPGGLARASDLPGVLSAAQVVTTTKQVELSRQDTAPHDVPLLGIDTTVDADVVHVRRGTYRSVPGYAFALAGAEAAASLDLVSLPRTVMVAGIPIIVTGILAGDPLLPELDNAIVTDDRTALAVDPAATDKVVLREAGLLTPARIQAALDPLQTTPLAINQPHALVTARAQSTGTLNGLAAVASAVAFGVAALAIAIMLTSAVRQRTAELAIRRVHGAPARSIAALISAEALVIAVIGGAIGLAVSNAAELVVAAVQDWPGTIRWQLQGVAFGAALLMCLMASLPPALVATRIQPSRAFAVE